MGSGDAKLADIDAVKACFRAQREDLTRKQLLRIEDVDAADTDEVAFWIWEVMRTLRVGVG
jgi:hypothetical protein